MQARENQLSPEKLRVLQPLSAGPIAWTCQDISSKVQDKLLQLEKANTEKEAQCLVGLTGFWIQYSSYLSVLL